MNFHSPTAFFAPKERRLWMIEKKKMNRSWKIPLVIWETFADLGANEVSKSMPVNLYSFFSFFPFYLSFSYLPLFKLPPPPLRYGAGDILFHILVAFFPPLKLIRGPHRAFCTHFVVSVVAISRNNTKTNIKQKEGKQATALNLICCSRKTVYELPLVVNALKKKVLLIFLLANSVSRESERNNGFQKRASWIILLTTHRKNQKS